MVHNNQPMPKLPTMTTVLLKAIEDSGLSLYSIANATGVHKSALGRFVSGKQSLRLDKADAIAAHLGLVLMPKAGGDGAGQVDTACAAALAGAKRPSSGRSQRKGR
jgi:hypothetical protein